MMFSLDGMPRHLPLSREARRRLREQVNAYKGEKPPLMAAFIPGGVMMALICVWMPAISYAPLPWKWIIVAAAVAVQLPVSFVLMMRAMWPMRCRAMAAVGYEVCPRCAYPISSTATEAVVCSECGSPRIVQKG